MKKHLIAAAVAGAFAVPAMAQVTVSGSISVGLVNTGQPNAKRFDVTNLGGGANALSFASTEDLGGGLRGGFQGQLRFSSATGDLAGSGTSDTGANTLHLANVFLSGGFGTVRLGKIGESGNTAFDPWGATGGAALMTGTGVSTLMAAGVIANGIGYSTPSIAGFSATVGQSVSARTNERQVFSLDYVAGPIRLQALHARNNQNTAGVDTAAPADAKITGQSIGASYNLGVATLMVVHVTSKNAAGAKTSDMMGIGATVPLGAVTVLAGYNKAKALGSITSANDTKWSLGANYALSKRTTLGADVYKAEATNATTGMVVRARHTF